MKSTSSRNVALALALTLALASLAAGAPKSKRTSKYLTIEGRVLQVNATNRTLLVSDLWSKTLYSVEVPKGGSFRITFGLNARTSLPEFRDVHRGDRVRMRCTRVTDRLARLDDGREVVALTSIR
ncbi:MAG TPA: hypothetical protein VLM38_00370 [Blastocatellia bacterium]|nr:hypothetical protein [Blastocatellia bacterium]